MSLKNQGSDSQARISLLKLDAGEEREAGCTLPGCELRLQGPAYVVDSVFRDGGDP